MNRDPSTYGSWWKVRYNVHYQDDGYIPDQELCVRATGEKEAAARAMKFETEHTDGCPIRAIDFREVSETNEPGSGYEYVEADVMQPIGLDEL